MSKLSLEATAELARPEAKPLISGLTSGVDREFLRENEVPDDFFIKTRKGAVTRSIRLLMDHTEMSVDDREKFWDEFFGEPATDIYELFRRAIMVRGNKREVSAAHPHVHDDTINDMLRRLPPRYGTWKNISREFSFPLEETTPMWMDAYHKFLREKKKRTDFGARMGTLFAMYEGAINSRWATERPLALPRDYITNRELSSLIANLRSGKRPEEWEPVDRVIHGLGFDDLEWRLLTAKAWLSDTDAGVGEVHKKPSRPKPTGRPPTVGLRSKNSTDAEYEPGLSYPEQLSGQGSEGIILECARQFAQRTDLRGLRSDTTDLKEIIDDIFSKAPKTSSSVRIALSSSAVVAPASQSKEESLVAPNDASSAVVDAVEEPLQTLVGQIHAVYLRRLAESEEDIESENSFDPNSVESFCALPVEIDRMNLSLLDHVYLVDSLDRAIDDLYAQSEGALSIADCRRLALERMKMSEADYDILTSRYGAMHADVSKKGSKWVDKWYENHPDVSDQLKILFNKYREAEVLTTKNIARTWMTFFSLNPRNFVTLQLVEILQSQRLEAEETLGILFDRLSANFDAFIDREPDEWMLNWLRSFSVIRDRFELDVVPVEDEEGATDDVPATEPVAPLDVLIDDASAEADEDTRFLFTDAHRYAIFRELWNLLADPESAKEYVHHEEFGRKQICLAGTNMGMTIIARRAQLGFPAHAISFDPSIAYPELPDADEFSFDAEAAALDVEEKLDAISLRLDGPDDDQPDVMAWPEDEDGGLADLDEDPLPPLSELPATESAEAWLPPVTESYTEPSLDELRAIESDETPKKRAASQVRDRSESVAEQVKKKKKKEGGDDKEGKKKRQIHTDVRMRQKAMEQIEGFDHLPKWLRSGLLKFVTAKKEELGGLTSRSIACLAVGTFSKQERYMALEFRDDFIAFTQSVMDESNIPEGETETVPDSTEDVIASLELTEQERDLLEYFYIHRNRVGPERKHHITPEEVALVANDPDHDQEECPSVMLSLRDKLSDAGLSFKIKTLFTVKYRMGAKQGSCVTWVMLEEEKKQ